MTAWIVLIITAYLFGSIPTSYLVARSRGIDLRRHGTRQVGGGNLWRTTSRKLGLVVGAFDFAKGLLMVWLAQLQGLDSGQQMVVGTAAIVGHNWPVFLRFHGGRGIATLLGIVIILPTINRTLPDYVPPWPSIIAIGFVLVFTPVLRSSPLPVLVGVASLPLTNWLFDSPWSVVMVYLAIFLIIVIKRLTAQPAHEPLNISTGRLLLNRFLFDRDIGDRKAWLHRKHESVRKAE